MYTIKLNSRNNTLTLKKVQRSIVLRQVGRRGLAGPQGEQGPAGTGLPAGGTTAQVARKASNNDYDIEYHTLVKADVGLANVDNTSDAAKPISSATQTALDAKEPTLAPGEASQYYRGDKTWQTLDNAAVGLGSLVDELQIRASQLDTDPTLSAAADDRVPSQSAVKSYVDGAALYFDARTFGALFDGMTDDTAAIQAAIGTAEAQGGGIVQLPRGTAIVQTLVLGNHVCLRGMGKYATILKLKNTTNAPVIKNYVSTDDIEANAQFCAVLDLQIDGNKANNTSAAHGISFLTSPVFSQATNDDWFDTHQLVQNVMIVRCKGIGFTATGRAEMRLKNVYVEKCDSGGFDPTYDTYMETCSAGNNGVYGFNFTHGNIMAVACKAFLSGRELATNSPGFYITGQGLATTLAGCIAQNNNGQGFQIVNASGVILSGCVADSNNYGTGNADDAYAGIELDTVTNCRIEYTSTQGYQNGVLIGNQKSALRLIGDSNSNNINVVTYAQSPYVLGTTLTSDSLPLMNHIEENGRITNTGDALTISRDKVLSQNGGRVRFFKRGNNVDNHASVLNGSQLGAITGHGWDGTAYFEQAQISMSATQDWTTVAHGSNFNFFTTANGTTSSAMALRIGQDKSVTFYGNQTPTTNLSFSNGGASNYWLNFYSQVLNLNSTFSISGSAAGIGTVTGDLRVTTAGTNAASVPTLNSTSTLANKTLNGPTITDASNVVLGSTTGTKIGTATTQKLAFYNSTPIVQPSGNVLTALTNLGLIASPTLTSTNVGLGNVDNTSNATERAATATLTNKRVTPRVGTVASSGTPTINTDNVDQFNITALAANITSFTTNLTGTPTDGDRLRIRIKDDGTPRTITWGASFVSSGVATLLATTAASKTHMVGLIYDAAAAKWVCVAVDAVGY